MKPDDEDTAGAPLRALPIDLDELIVALTSHRDLESGHWLDLETGALVFFAEDIADEIGEDPRDNERFVEVEPIESHRSFRVMEDFVAQLADQPLVRQLDEALRQRKPFRRFKDVLADHPQTREAWFAFEHAAMERHARAWCESQGIAPQW